VPQFRSRPSDLVFRCCWLKLTFQRYLSLKPSARAERPTITGWPNEPSVDDDELEAEVFCQEDVDTMFGYIEELWKREIDAGQLRVQAVEAPHRARR